MVPVSTGTDCLPTGADKASMNYLSMMVREIIFKPRAFERTERIERQAPIGAILLNFGDAGGAF